MRTLSFATVLAVASLAIATPVSDASACGGFFSARPNPERRPSLAYEQALIVHDAVKGREHFIREIVFRASDETFGFVVPTPTLPEVAKVDKSPFSTLRETFPFEIPPPGGGKGEGFGLGSLGGLGRGAGPGVSVLDVQKVGSFTAFVLAADDAAALAKWLKDNGLVSSPETDPWLAHYVKAKFYYVAMRYDPPAKDAKPSALAGAPPKAAGKQNKTEVVRISFDTPRAYYPYYEPEKPPGMADGPRLLEIWLATHGSTTQPIAVSKRDGKAQLLRPFGEGQRFDEAREGLTKAMGKDASLLPEGTVQLQRFMDQKQRRTGWGDVVFVPERRDPRDPVTDAALKKLAPVLDTTLLPGEAK
jgi:hypothetical protein